MEDSSQTSEERLVQELGVTMKLPVLSDDQIQKASFFLIRHGYSEYNFKDAMIEKQYGEDSPEHKAMKLD